MLTGHGRALEVTGGRGLGSPEASLPLPCPASGTFSGHFQRCPLSLCPLPHVGQAWVEVTASVQGNLLSKSNELGEIPALPPHS